MEDAHTGVARGPDVAALPVVKFVEDMVGAAVGEGVHRHMLEAEETGGMGADGLEVDAVGACPLAVFRRHGVGHGALGKILRRAVGGRDGGAGGEGEVHGYERQPALGAHLEDNLRAVRRYVVYPHLRALVEEALVFCAFHPGAEDVAFVVFRLFLDAGREKQRQTQHKA